MKGKQQSDTKNNVNSTKNNIDRTQQNIEFANELMAETSDKSIKGELDQKNGRRERAIADLQKEVKKEAKHHKP